MGLYEQHQAEGKARKRTTLAWSIRYWFLFKRSES